MKRWFLVFVSLFVIGVHAEESEKPQEEETALTPLQSRDVVEQLKTMRAQLLLEQEYNRLLELRVKRLELEMQLGLEPSKSNARKDLPKAPAAFPRSPRSPSSSSARVLIVKSVTVQPFKEAYVIYKDRVYTVRPGDKLDDLIVKDITEDGVVTNKMTVRRE